jgi:N-acetylglucosaminyl-diphospho-decaprenol L-rhamnosyltransferase
MEKISKKQHAAGISISVISHGQIHLIEGLLHDINIHCDTLSLQLILTLNLDEMLPFAEESFSFPMEIIRNKIPMGFSANHNQAFVHATERFFCVMNPDIRLDDDPFPVLLSCLQDASVGLAAPLVLGESGAVEDSARLFPTPLKILCKAVGQCKDGDYAVKDETIFPDWVAGMFMVFRSEVLDELGGFDQRYFLYYEDVDLCARLRLRGYEVAMCPAAKVVHYARRHSHSNLKYLSWHLASMTRFFCSPPFLKIFWRQLTKRPF